jgi:hypothetical protein
MQRLFIEADCEIVIIEKFPNYKSDCRNSFPKIHGKEHGWRGIYVGTPVVFLSASP